MNDISRHGLFISLFIVSTLFSQARAGELTLALANSTCDAMNTVEDLYRASRPVRFTYLCKSSGLLAKGLHGGALKADLFVSADREWMDFAVANGLVESNRVTSPWGNALVVAGAKNNPRQRLDWQDLASDKVTVILIGDPSTAPFGRHAKEALEASGMWERVKHKIQTRKHVQLVAATLETSSPGTVGNCGNCMPSIKPCTNRFAITWRHSKPRRAIRTSRPFSNSCGARLSGTRFKPKALM
jgi:molybdate transport system substrate-binding protein